MNGKLLSGGFHEKRSISLIYKLTAYWQQWPEVTAFNLLESGARCQIKHLLRICIALVTWLSDGTPKFATFQSMPEGSQKQTPSPRGLRIHIPEGLFAMASSTPSETSIAYNHSARG